MIEDILALCITLDPSSKERALRAKKEISKLGFKKFAFAPGVKGKNIPDDDLRDLLTSRAYYELKNGRYVHEALSSVGAVGCYLAHLQCWSRGTEQTVAIFEDDFVSTPNAKEDVEKAYNDAASRGFDILRLAYNKNPDIKVELKKVSENLNKMSRSECAAAYIVSPHGASILLEKALPIEMHVDHFIDITASNNGLNQYFVKHSLYTDPRVESIVDHSKIEMYQDGLSKNTAKRHTKCLIVIFIITCLAVAYIYYLRKRHRFR